MPPLALVRGPASPRPSASAHEIDGELLSRAQRGDDDACRAIVECYQGRIFAVVGRTLGAARAARVEDVCQECFLKVFGALKRFDPDGPAKLSTWILTIATRLCLDELRSRRRFVQDELSDDLAAPAVTEPMALERALRRRVEGALAVLPAELRATFALRITAELSVADTARVLGVDEGTVVSDDDSDAIGKRIGFRHQQMWDAMKPATR